MPNIELIYQHSDFIIANKPAGIDFHNNQDKLGFYHQVKSQLDLTALYPVHRLDKDTSGLIIFAKTLAAEHYFNQALQQSGIEKYYLAISHNKPKQKQGRVIGDMEKSRNKAWKITRTNLNPAKTFFYSYGLGNKLRLFLLKPYTGKTHQLRVAMRSLSAAILGDTIYKGESADRLYLHAYALKFNYLGQDIEITNLPHSGKHFLDISSNEEIRTKIDKPWCHKWPRI